MAVLPVQPPGFILLKTSLSLFKGLKMKNHKFIKAVVFTLSVLAVTAGFISCEDEVSGSGYAEWAGVRCSPYGWKVDGKRQYPSESTLKSYVNKIRSFYNKDEAAGSRGVVVLIVGTVSEEDDYSCSLGFPNKYPDGHEKAGTQIASFSKGKTGAGFRDEDRYDSYLSALDGTDIDVWLQVESGFADIVKLAKVVMNRYQNHPCVKGFGVDVEWYQNTTDGQPGVPLTDTVAKNVDDAVKAVNTEYSVFVKHWETGYLPPSYRGVNNDMVFVTDSQGFGNIGTAKSHYRQWAEHYDPNPVFFQIAYDDDEGLWKNLDRPLADYGSEILTSIEDSSQKRGIVWVDFTFIDAYNMSK